MHCKTLFVFKLLQTNKQGLLGDRKYFTGASNKVWEELKKQQVSEHVRDPPDVKQAAAARQSWGRGGGTFFWA